MPHPSAGRSPLASRLALPVTLSILLIAVAPVFGRLRDRLLEWFGAPVFELVGAAVAVSLAFALAAALWRIRGQPGARGQMAARYGAIAAALALALAALGGWQSGHRVVDLVERVHVVEYGLLGALYFRAFAGRLRDPTLPVAAFAAVMATAALDEGAQWLTPLRVGDVRDLALDAISGIAGIVFAWGLAPPAGFRLAPSRRSLAVGAWAAAVAVVAVGGFWSVARLGYEIDDRELGVTFLSAYPAERLERLAAERAAAWRGRPPGEPAAYAVEDLYLTEAVRHVQERNRAFDAGRHAQAYWENRILERWYAPVLDLAGRRSGAPHRWTAAQRAEAARAVPRARRPPPARSAGWRPHYRSPVLADRVEPRPSRAVGFATTAAAAASLAGLALFAGVGGVGGFGGFSRRRGGGAGRGAADRVGGGGTSSG